MKPINTYIKKTGLLFLGLFILASCSSDDDNDGDGTVAEQSSEKAITNFTFLASDNDALAEDLEGTIDEDTKTITAELPYGTDVSGLVPTIAISEDATVDPENKTATDFTDAVSYTVTAEDGSEAEYTASITVGPSGAKAITTFTFLATDNEMLTEDLVGAIDEDTKTITAELPYGTDVSDLVPTITISEDATVDPENKTATDFTDAVTYTVTAEDGSEAEYTITVAILPPTEREVLIDLYNANPNNTLDWDLEDEDISNWEGVTQANGRILKLELSYGNLNYLPSSIVYLTDLEELWWRGNSLTEIPLELGNLANLKVLSLGYNSLTELPAELWNLTNLEFLDLQSNNLTALPQEIGNLSNLVRLYLNQNSLEAVPEEVGNLSNLEFLILYGNDLDSIPAEIGNLSNLTHLYIYNNQITTIPQAICDLSLSDFRRGNAVCED